MPAPPAANEPAPAPPTVAAPAPCQYHQNIVCLQKDRGAGCLNCVYCRPTALLLFYITEWHTTVNEMKGHAGKYSESDTGGACKQPQAKLPPSKTTLPLKATDELSPSGVSVLCPALSTALPIWYSLPGPVPRQSLSVSPIFAICDCGLHHRESMPATLNNIFRMTTCLGLPPYIFSQFQHMSVNAYYATMQG